MLRVLIFLSLVYGLSGCGTDTKGSSSSLSSSSSSAAPIEYACNDAHNPCQILSIGDGIIQGLQVSADGYSIGGFQIPLQKLAKADGKYIDFVGMHESVVGIERYKHAGFTGMTIKRLDNMIPDPLPSRFTPDIVLFHIGYMDVIMKASTNLGDYDLSRLYTMLQDIHRTAPKALVLISSSVQLYSHPEASRALASGVRAVVNQLIQKEPGIRIKLVDHNLSDGVLSANFDPNYPSEAGYKWLAETWYDAFKGHLK